MGKSELLMFNLSSPIQKEEEEVANVKNVDYRFMTKNINLDQIGL